MTSGSSKVIIVGVSGRNASARSVVAERLVAELGFKQVSLLEPVYRLASAVSGLSIEKLRSTPRGEGVPSDNLGTQLFPRKLVRAIDDAARLELGRAFWAQEALHTAAQLGLRRVVIPDVTRLADLRYLAACGALLVRVNLLAEHGAVESDELPRFNEGDVVWSCATESVNASDAALAIGDFAGRLLGRSAP